MCARVWLRCRLLTSFSLWALALQAEPGCNGSLWDELHPGCRVGKAEALCSCRPLGLSNALWGEAGTAAAPGGRAAGVATEETPLAPAALPLLQVLLQLKNVLQSSRNNLLPFANEILFLLTQVKAQAYIEVFLAGTQCQVSYIMLTATFSN